MTQRQAVKEYLLTHKSISSWEAFMMFGATRLSAIIFDLRKTLENDKIKIISVPKTIKNRYGQITNYVEYHLVDIQEDEK